MSVFSRIFPSAERLEQMQTEINRLNSLLSEKNETELFLRKQLRQADKSYTGFVKQVAHLKQVTAAQADTIKWLEDQINQTHKDKQDTEAERDMLQHRERALIDSNNELRAKMEALEAELYPAGKDDEA